MSIAANLSRIKSEIPIKVKLVAVSKMNPPEKIWEAYNEGQKIFGENRPQELISKYEVLPKDIEWHLIGHLQTNKVKSVVPFVSLIHSVDSLYLLLEIEKQAAKINRIVNCLLQFHIADEESKFGFSEIAAFQMFQSQEIKNIPHVNLLGVMGMATYTEDMDLVRNEFKKLYNIFIRLKGTYFYSKLDFCEISMGMSGDYRIAIEEGSTLIRVGSAIFGDRNY